MRHYLLFRTLFLITSLFLVQTSVFAIARTWVGIGSGGAGTDFNAAANWSPSGVPTSADDLTITMTSGGTILVSASITVNSITFSASGSNNVCVLDVQTFTLTMNATSSFSVPSGNLNTRGILHAGTAPGKCVFRGDVNFNLTGSSIFKFRATVGNPGNYEFYANVTTGQNVLTEPGDEPRFLFDKAGTQSWTFNSTANYIVPNSIIVGQSNTPTVNFIGAGNAALLNIYGGVLTVRPNCTLDIGKFATDKLNGSGAVTLGANSFLRIGATNDFPTGFTVYSLDITSTVEFYGTASTQNVGAMPGVDNYGNLILSGGGSKQQTSVGGIYVRGNMTVAAGTTYWAWAELTTVDGTCTINGTYDASSSNQTFNGHFTNNGTWVQSTTASSVAIFSGSAAQNLSGTTTNTAFYRMTVNNSSPTGLFFFTPFEVINALTLTDGYVFTSNTALLILRNNCTSTPGSNDSFVDGPMRKIGNQAFVFPVGDQGFWARIAISAPGNTSDHFTAEYFANAYSPLTPVSAPLQYVSSVEHWILDRTNGSSNVFVTLYWESGTRSGINTFSSDLRVARWNGATWLDHGSSNMTGSVAAGTVRTSAVVTAFSPFTFASLSAPATNPLPIELTAFAAECKQTFTEITWTTATETNNRLFQLEGSSTGSDFTVVTTINGAGNSIRPLHYRYEDRNLAKFQYYRLKQIDYDGNFTYYSPVKANHCESSLNQFQAVVKNDNSLIIHIETRTNSYLDLRLINALGQQVYSEKFLSNGGHEQKSLDLSQFKPGIYFLSIAFGPNDGKTQKLIVQ